jgi:hypothetical protein
VVFTDDPARFPRQHGVSIVYRKDLGWPLTAMLRYRSFLDCWHLLAHADFIFRYLFLFARAQSAKLSVSGCKRCKRVGASSTIHRVCRNPSGVSF